MESPPAACVTCARGLLQTLTSTILSRTYIFHQWAIYQFHWGVWSRSMKLTLLRVIVFGYKAKSAKYWQCNGRPLVNSLELVHSSRFIFYIPRITDFKGGTEEDDYCYGVAMAGDDSVILAGYTYGDWGAVNAGDSDFVAVKLDAAGEEIWVWQVSHALDAHLGNERSCTRRHVL